MNDRRPFTELEGIKEVGRLLFRLDLLEFPGEFIVSKRRHFMHTRSCEFTSVISNRLFSFILSFFSGSESLSLDRRRVLELDECVDKGSRDN